MHHPPPRATLPTSLSESELYSFPSSTVPVLVIRNDLRFSPASVLSARSLCHYWPCM